MEAQSQLRSDNLSIRLIIASEPQYGNYNRGFTDSYPLDVREVFGVHGKFFLHGRECTSTCLESACAKQFGLSV